MNARFKVLSSWMYSNSAGRDLRLDLLRGFCLFAMMVDHFDGGSFLYALTGQAQFYITAAEAFYFISGLTLGLISAKASFGQASARVLSRAMVLYRTAVGIALGFWVCSTFLHLNVWDQAWDTKGNMLEFILGLFTLQNGYNGSQILALYVLLMLFAPLAFYALSKGKGWVVLGVSGLVYAISQIAPNVVGTPIASIFMPAAWQVLFFFGLVIGHHRTDLAAWWARLPKLRDGLGGILLIAAVGILVMYATGHRLEAALGEDNKFNLVPLRLLLVGLFLQAFYVLVTWAWRPLASALGWLLLPLGSASLWAFTMHFVVMLPLYNLTDYWTLTQNPLWGTLLQLLGVAAVWASIVLYRKLRSPSKITLIQST